jgi:hypothetical protein
VIGGGLVAWLEYAAQSRAATASVTATATAQAHASATARAVAALQPFPAHGTATTGSFQGQVFDFHGTGDLARLNGQGTFQGQGDHLTYSCELHFGT